jgi:hypothetical protein
MSARVRLVSYRPLAHYPWGLDEAVRRGLPPFADASTRPEPDLCSPFPSITSLCRGANFAPHIDIGDIIIYITCQGSYFNELAEPHWRLTAILHVYRTFPTHTQAAEWYRSRHLPIPGNCMVWGNPPLPDTSAWQRQRMPLSRQDARSLPTVRQDKVKYLQRAAKWPVLHACEPEYVNVTAPPSISRKDLIHIFNRVPATQNPPYITYAQLESLRAFCH